MGRRLICLIALAAICFGCKNNKEDNDLAAAQKCLDQVPDSNPGQAAGCMSYINQYTDAQANVLKCSILDTSAGLTNSKIVSAYNILKSNSSANKAASFMVALSMNTPTVDQAYTSVVQADSYCQASGIAGLKYISGLIVAGTYMTKSMESLAIPVNINDVNSVGSAVTSLISQCSGNPSSCTTADTATMGATVTTLASSYCGTQSADQNVCGQVTAAVNAAGGSPQAVGQALFCYMNNQTYNTSTGLCQ